MFSALDLIRNVVLSQDLGARGSSRSNNTDVLWQHKSRSRLCPVTWNSLPAELRTLNLSVAPFAKRLDYCYYNFTKHVLFTQL